VKKVLVNLKSQEEVPEDPTEEVEVVTVVVEVTTAVIKKVVASSEMSKSHMPYMLIGKMRTRDMRITTEVDTEETRRKTSLIQ
jgi:hypothetical protein